MDKYKLKRKNSHYFETLRQLVVEGMNMGLDLKETLSKIENLQKSINDGIVRIVLLGSFSDGKTSIIAGLLGELIDNMKIDVDESSDELAVYKPNGLKEGYEIVDTPGLFGTKEKESDGKKIKLSKITEDYLSEAHIVIYVCDAVNPLKDSHVDTIRWIMRTLHKLNSSIFVINKMDEAGFDLTDDEEYCHGENIKRSTLIKRLRETINLTPEEEKRIQIACIASDPKSKGLEHWFAKPNEYLRRSHIEALRHSLDCVVERSDADKLRSSTTAIAIQDTLNKTQREIELSVVPLKNTLKKIENSCLDLGTECAVVKQEVDINRNIMARQLDEYKSSLYADINGASIETFSDILDRALGREGDNITGYVVEREIYSIIQTCDNSNQQTLKMASVKFEREFNAHNEWVQGAMKKGVGQLSKVAISGDKVIQFRNFLQNTLGVEHKFKPWGAIKLANRITKVIGRVAAALTVVMEICKYWKQHKALKELDEAKKQLLKELDKMFAEVYRQFKNEKDYYVNFAQVYLDLCEQLREREQEIEQMKNQIELLESYSQRIGKHLNENIETIEYEEIL